MPLPHFLHRKYVMPGLVSSRIRRTFRLSQLEHWWRGLLRFISSPIRNRGRMGEQSH